MAVVGGDQRDAAFFGEADQIAIDANVLFEALVLHFEKEILLAENVAQAMRVGFGLIVFFGKDGVGNFSAKAGGEGDQAFTVFGESS